MECSYIVDYTMYSVLVKKRSKRRGYGAVWWRRRRHIPGSPPMQALRLNRPTQAQWATGTGGEATREARGTNQCKDHVALACA